MNLDLLQFDVQSFKVMMDDLRRSGAVKRWRRSLLPSVIMYG